MVSTEDDALISKGDLKDRANLFQLGEITLHSGMKSFWKIECDALADADLRALARIAAAQMEFSSVISVPRGGDRLAVEMAVYAERDSGYPALIVDDVLTTGKSMQEARQRYPGAIGLVIFARGICPPWVRPIFQSFF